MDTTNTIVRNGHTRDRFWSGAGGDEKDTGGVRPIGRGQTKLVVYEIDRENFFIPNRYAVSFSLLNNQRYQFRPFNAMREARVVFD